MKEYIHDEIAKWRKGLNFLGGILFTTTVPFITYEAYQLLKGMNNSIIKLDKTTSNLNITVQNVSKILDNYELKFQNQDVAIHSIDNRLTIVEYKVENIK